MKRCIWCGRDLQETEFYQDARYADGLMSGCKECRRKKSKLQKRRKKERSVAQNPVPMTPRERWEAMFV